MKYYAGLDVSLKEISICVVDQDGGIAMLGCAGRSSSASFAKNSATGRCTCSFLDQIFSTSCGAPLRSLLASASIVLPSTAASVPPTNPKVTHFSTALSNKRRITSPFQSDHGGSWRTWSDPEHGPPSPNLQNHRYARFRCTSSTRRRSDRMP